MWDHLGRRVAFEGEELIAHRFQSGSVEMVALTDFDYWRAGAGVVARLRRPDVAVWRMHPWHSFCNFVGEFLRHYGFLNAVMAPPPTGEPGPVVEIRPDSLLRLRDIPQAWQERYRFEPLEDALFINGTGQEGNSGRALCFGNGTIISWKLLRDGQRVRVLRQSWMESLELQPDLVKIKT